MSETDDVPAPTEDAAGGTGNAEVDAVVETLVALDEFPVADHVTVFEQAHESLRRTLSGAGQDGPAAGRS